MFKHVFIYSNLLLYAIMDETPKVVHRQETIVEKERQTKKREAEREMKEARPQSLAFSYTDTKIVVRQRKDIYFIM